MPSYQAALLHAFFKDNKRIYKGALASPSNHCMCADCSLQDYQQLLRKRTPFLHPSTVLPKYLHQFHLFLLTCCTASSLSSIFCSSAGPSLKLWLPAELAGVVGVAGPSSPLIESLAGEPCAAWLEKLASRSTFFVACRPPASEA